MTAARCANARPARRTAGLSTDPVNPWAITVPPSAGKSRPKPAVHGSYTASTVAPSAVLRGARRVP